MLNLSKVFEYLRRAPPAMKSLEETFRGIPSETPGEVQRIVYGEIPWRNLWTNSDNIFGGISSETFEEIHEEIQA